MYKKRDGTSAIKGQLYVTKLISLINFRAKFDNSLKDCYLATNMADIGTFADICFRAEAKIAKHNKQIAIFIQTTHKEDGKTVLTLNSKNDLAEWFASYLTIKRSFKQDTKDVFFKGTFQDIDTYFIMYTTAKKDRDNVRFNTEVAHKLNSLIATGNDAVQPNHKETDIEFLCEIVMKEQLVELATVFAEFVNKDDNTVLSMNNDLILIYHVILAKKFFLISEIRNKNEDSEHRIARFRSEFYTSDDEFMKLFRDTLYKEILEKRKLDDVTRNEMLARLFVEPLDKEILAKLIYSVVTLNNKNGKLEFKDESMSEDLRHRLEKVKVLRADVYEAISKAAEEILRPQEIKVPVAFGNKDLTVRGSEDTNDDFTPDSILVKVKNKMVEMLLQSAPGNIVTIDKNVEKEFSKININLASIVGNILIADQNSEYMKFPDNTDTLGDVEKQLFSELQSAIPNLQDFKFILDVETSPVLSLEKIDLIEDDISALATTIGIYLDKNTDSVMPTTDNILRRYHVALTHKVLDISEIMGEDDDAYRLATFQQEFFESEEDSLVLFKRHLYAEVLKGRNLGKNELEDSLAIFFNDPYNKIALGTLINTVLLYTNRKFQFINSNAPDEEKQVLDKIELPQSVVDDAINVTAKTILMKREFKVSTAFGNKDLKESIAEERLDHLKMKLYELMSKSSDDKVVAIDESLGEDFLKLTGGIAGMVGNILVLDEDTQLLKFTDNWESLQDTAKRLFIKLKRKTPNLHEYKFNVNVKRFPKLSFKRSGDDEKVAKDFLNRLLFYTNQADERGVEKHLKDEIEDHQCLSVDSIKVTADAIFLQYHDQIQQWWMLKEAEYLTKESSHYEEALKLIVDKPLLSIISKMYAMKMGNIVDITFNDHAVKSLNLTEQSTNVIFVTENIPLTVVKLMQSLNKSKHIVMDLEDLLQTKDYATLIAELTKIEQNKIIILACDNIQRNSNKRLENISNILNEKRIIIVTNTAVLDTVQIYFKDIKEIRDDRCSLADMSEKSQKTVLQAKVNFQDVEVTLDTIVDKESMQTVEGVVLNDFINNETRCFSNSVTNVNYEKVKHLYVDRRVCRVHPYQPPNYVPAVGKQPKYFVHKDIVEFSNLNDLSNIVLLSAKPGMGKSTLLTNLSIKTKESNPKIWIVRVNLLDHCEKFNKWQENKVDIDILETLKFLCPIIVGRDKKSDLEFDLEESEGEVQLKSCRIDNPWTVFEIKMFLDYFNRKELIFLFDGFDEICPLYTEEVLCLLKVVRNYTNKHKMWITSRFYEKIMSRLEQEFGKAYEVEDFNESELDGYLCKYWQSTIILRNLNKQQSNNLCSFMEFMSKHYYKTYKTDVKTDVVRKREKYQILFMKVCFNFLYYLRKELNICPENVIQTFNQIFHDCTHSVIYMEGFDTPLHLYLTADYFQNQVNDDRIIPNRWNLDINAFTVYDKFIETKLKTIRFQEKNKIDLYNPDNLAIYEEIREDFFVKHYKLGAYAVFNRDVNKIFDENELSEIRKTIENIKIGTEKTGLVHSIIDDIPTFIHRTFTEYFAVKYICQLLKSATEEESQRNIWDFILNVVFLKCDKNVRQIFGYRLKTDNVLKAKVYECEEVIFNLLLTQGTGVHAYNPDDFSKELYLKVKKHLRSAMRDELVNFVSTISNLKEKMSEDYIKDYTRATSKIKRLKFLHSVRVKRQACFPETWRSNVLTGPAQITTKRRIRTVSPREVLEAQSSPPILEPQASQSSDP
ncbi:uncharacterized protein LOC118278558 [Spodoptera frugiperda]|uniref:Uncharacterized protein LOC118278558 n=1 Tax=Spodoptera frugiperda TaxID=7108 RepID=A0A9R0E6R6_SPOFR|nr:uncharacterized protein LOC118278558 [Spodoptera frugiperda]